MFVSVLELFKIGIGPSSSHTMGPMVAAKDFRGLVSRYASEHGLPGDAVLRCTLKGSLAFTGRGHATDRAVTLGLHDTPEGVASEDVEAFVRALWQNSSLAVAGGGTVRFSPVNDIIFDQGEPLPEHPNGMIFELTGGAVNHCSVKPISPSAAASSAGLRKSSRWWHPSRCVRPPPAPIPSIRRGRCWKWPPIAVCPSPT